MLEINEEVINEENDSVSVEETKEVLEQADESSIVKTEDKNKGDWYIIQTYSNHEHKVKISLENRIQSLKLQDKVFEILVPEEEVVEVKNNKKIEKLRKMYPGYIFVRMLFDSELWYILKRVPGLSKFMGNSTKPMPVSDEDILKVLRQVGVKVQKFQVDFEVGDMIKIITGPFRGYSGAVKEINPEKGKIKSTVLIFGRETPVEISFDQVEKLTK
jgi:transcription termination/antitermination protein NusG